MDFIVNAADRISAPERAVLYCLYRSSIAALPTKHAKNAMLMDMLCKLYNADEKWANDLCAVAEFRESPHSIDEIQTAYNELVPHTTDDAIVSALDAPKHSKSTLVLIRYWIKKAAAIVDEHPEYFSFGFMNVLDMLYDFVDGESTSNIMEEYASYIERIEFTLDTCTCSIATISIQVHDVSPLMLWVDKTRVAIYEDTNWILQPASAVGYHLLVYKASTHEASNNTKLRYITYHNCNDHDLLKKYNISPQIFDDIVLVKNFICDYVFTVNVMNQTVLRAVTYCILNNQQLFKPPMGRNDWTKLPHHIFSELVRTALGVQDDLYLLCDAYYGLSDESIVSEADISDTIECAKLDLESPICKLRPVLYGDKTQKNISKEIRDCAFWSYDNSAQCYADQWYLAHTIDY